MAAIQAFFAPRSEKARGESKALLPHCRRLHVFPSGQKKICFASSALFLCSWMDDRRGWLRWTVENDGIIYTYLYITSLISQGAAYTSSKQIRSWTVENATQDCSPVSLPSTVSRNFMLHPLFCSINALYLLSSCPVTAFPSGWLDMVFTTPGALLPVPLSSNLPCDHGRGSCLPAC